MAAGGDSSDGAKVTPIGKAARAVRRRSLGARVIPDQPIWDQMRRIGGQLTPIQLSQIIREADTGQIRRLIDIANDSRQKDAHLSAVLSQSEESIVGLEWNLQFSPLTKAVKKERDALKWIETWLRTKVLEPFTGLLSHLAGAPYYSFAVSETQWSKDPKGRLVPVDWTNQNHRRFGFREADGKLVWRDTGMPQDGVDVQATYPNRFVVAQPRVTGDVPAREGLLRVLVWAALFRNWDLTDWLRTGEIAWKPWRLGYYDKNASEEDIDNLTAVLDELASTGSAALPDTTEAKIHWPGGAVTSRPMHSELFNVLAQEMSKAVLGQTETVQSSESSGYAQAKVHQAVAANILRARARHVAAVITRDVVRPMVELNFGRNVQVPAFHFLTQDPIDLRSFSEGVRNFTAAAGARLRIPAKWARATAGIPDPEEGEEVIGEVEPTAGEGETPGTPGKKPAETGGTKPNPAPTENNPEDNEGSPAESGDAGGGGA